MASSFARTLAAIAIASASFASASVTVYATTGTAAAATPTQCIGAVPCDGSVLTPVGPQQNMSTTVPVQLFTGGMTGLSIRQNGHFAGFSLELSVIDHLLGNDGDAISPIFMNLMTHITSRAGKVLLRVGGNTQEQATVVPEGLPKDASIQKVQFGTDKTFTPVLLVSPSLIYAMGNISQHIEAEWFLGVPFNDTANPRTLIAEIAQAVLGDKLLGLQLGNEPDLYHNNALRSTDYTPAEYTTEWGQVLADYQQDSKISNGSMFIAPSVCCGGSIGWNPEQVWDTGFLNDYANSLAYLSVQHYPSDNCNSSGTPNDPQQLLDGVYANHNSVQGQTSSYLNSTNIAQQLQKPFIMFETNTASCGGFSGLSDSFAAAMWTVDYALTLAYGNFSYALFHVGGQSDFYNPFTPPSTNQSHFRQWTIGPTFYSNLVIAEALGTSGNAQVVDLFLNSNGAFTPGYAIYENGNPERVVLINYITDPTGASNYTAYLSVGGNQTGQAAATPASVQVKYLLAASASDHFNISWAGQTFGGPFESDGRLQGDEMIYTYTCDTVNNVCAIPMPAPAVALVFLNSNALSESEPTTTLTFATTTTATGPANTATVPQAVLATSNGRGGGQWDSEGSTSFGSVNSGVLGSSAFLASAVLTGIIALLGAVFIVNGGWP